MHDRVLSGGLVVDGTGGAAFRADVGIDGDRITEIGVDLAGDDVLDAESCLITPGFIDLHTHYDAQVLWDPLISPSSQLGVTSVIAGNCGFSLAPCPPDQRNSIIATFCNVEDMRPETLHAGIAWDFETYSEYLGAVAGRGVAINFGGYVGHTAVRQWVMGDEAFDRPANNDELEQMAAVVRDAVLGGALGFSSDRSPFHRGDGGRPVPSAVADPAEIARLWQAVDEAGRGLIHVAPGEDFTWVYDLAKTVTRPVTWSAILAYPPGAGSKAPWSSKVEYHRSHSSSAPQVHPQVTCRPLTFQISMADPSTFYMVPAFAQIAAAAPTDRPALYRQADWRQAAAEQFDSRQYVDIRWDAAFVTETSLQHYQGHTLADIAEKENRHPLDVALDIALSEDLATRFTINFANDDPAAVAALLSEPGLVLGLSDAGAHLAQICDAILPLDFLANWVRDRALCSAEEGIRRLTGELAGILGLDRRGLVREGYAADLTVLEWDELDPGPVRRTTDFPAQGDRLVADSPRGLRHVLVNGTPIRRAHQPSWPQRLPGQLLTQMSPS
jgi:N-acyl-D-aspartate/D-glutamate deacylase